MIDTIEVTAPRYVGGNLLGYYDATVVSTLWIDPDRDAKGEDAFLVRFEDGHEAGVFRRELRATARNWSLIDHLSRDTFREDLAACHETNN